MSTSFLSLIKRIKKRFLRHSACEFVLIKPLPSWKKISFYELWQYRELLIFLTLRDVKVRYKQTILGIAWAVIQPFFMMLVFTVFFGRFIKLSSGGVPYPIFSYVALLPWVTFTESINRAVNSLVQDANLIKKIYFPRLIMPLAGVLSPLVDFFFSFLVFLGILFYFDYFPSKNILMLPFFIILEVLLALSISLWLSALNVLYRDVRYAVPFLLQIWFFVSPIVYSTGSLPDNYRKFYSLNPMVVIIEGFRWSILGKTDYCFDNLAMTILIVFLILIGGLIYFYEMEKSFADLG